MKLPKIYLGKEKDGSLIKKILVGSLVRDSKTQNFAPSAQQAVHRPLRQYASVEAKCEISLEKKEDSVFKKIGALW